MGRSGSGTGRLAGRRILVTGAASGMGKAIAETFSREGAALILLDRDGEGLDATASAVGALACRTDVTSEAEVGAAVARALSELGGLDGVVNAAGILAREPLMDTPPETWRRVFEVNVMGPLLICRAALPALAANDVATIVNVASVSGLAPSLHYCAYSASKAALVSLTRSLAMEAPAPVRANAICPGPIITPMVAAYFPGATDQSGDPRVAVSERMGLPREIADAALYLTSRESSFVNGECLVVDGGRVFR